MAKPFKRRDSRYWWISPTVDGIQKPQSTKTTDYQEALDMLKRLEGKIVDGIVNAHTGRTLFSELCDLHERNYKIKGRTSLPDLKRRLKKHIKPVFGDMKASAIGPTAITAYIEKRQDAKASNGEINRELSAIRRAFRLGKKNGLVVTIPDIEFLPEDNARQGFFGEDHFRSVLRFANPMLKDVLIVAYYTGWRIKSILNLEWSNVETSVIRLRRNQTKNKKDTVFPLGLFPELAQAIERRKESAKGLITPWVFQRKAEKVKSIRKAWEIARGKAKVPGRVIHDFRRTAVRNLDELGFKPTEVMQMVGIKTMSIYLRYSISTESDILRKAKAIASNTV